MLNATLGQRVGQSPGRVIPHYFGYRRGMITRQAVPLQVVDCKLAAVLEGPAGFAGWVILPLFVEERGRILGSRNGQRKPERVG